MLGRTVGGRIVIGMMSLLAYVLVACAPEAKEPANDTDGDADKDAPSADPRPGEPVTEDAEVLAQVAQAALVKADASGLVQTGTLQPVTSMALTAWPQIVGRIGAQTPATVGHYIRVADGTLSGKLLFSGTPDGRYLTRLIDMKLAPGPGGALHLAMIGTLSRPGE